MSWFDTGLPSLITYLAEHDRVGSREALRESASKLLDSLLEGFAVHGAESAAGRDGVASKRVRFAVRNGLLLAGPGGGLASGVLFGLGGLRLGFGLRGDFTIGVAIGPSVT